ncbi:hypothetical protein B5C26_01455 [Photorhabdus luminescens]|uniref:Uncharacterized protein n=1 Tax=Photorhabdus luminescens subsp. mexicana TaxID=2100167 RepID=A0A4V2X4U5_PHOLU|nr:hypothetical protein B5C26_01455 [Photorhabdus luminescens]TDB45695.1 hypothetical protein C5468_20230 [Photorhabdus luminescens subsp. mexicana]
MLSNSFRIIKKPAPDRRELRQQRLSYNNSYIPVIFQVASLLAALTHPSHIVIYAPGDSFTCRRAATRNLLGIDKFLIHSFYNGGDTLA